MHKHRARVLYQDRAMTTEARGGGSHPNRQIRPLVLYVSASAGLGVGPRGEIASALHNQRIPREQINQF